MDWLVDLGKGSDLFEFIVYKLRVVLCRFTLYLVWVLGRRVRSLVVIVGMG